MQAENRAKEAALHSEFSTAGRGVPNDVRQYRLIVGKIRRIVGDVGALEPGGMAIQEIDDTAAGMAGGKTALTEGGIH